VIMANSYEESGGLSIGGTPGAPVSADAASAVAAPRSC
jgi:hypothetical protein